jgi:hypothetical protein
MDEELSNFSKNLCSTFFHVFGTCSIGKVLVDGNLASSRRPTSVCCFNIFKSDQGEANPQQAIMTMARRAADIIVQTKKGCTDKDLGTDQHADKGKKWFVVKSVDSDFFLLNLLL